MARLGRAARVRSERVQLPASADARQYWTLSRSQPTRVPRLAIAAALLLFMMAGRFAGPVWAWTLGTVAAILANPRYTGRQM